MRSILIVFIVTVFLSGIMAVASAADVIELSTLNRASSVDTISLPQLSASMPTIAPTALGGSTRSNVMDLSTLGRKLEADVPATEIKSASPITITPMFAVRNANITTGAATVVTLPHAISSSASVYTPPIAIFGGA